MVSIRVKKKTIQILVIGMFAIVSVSILGVLYQNSQVNLATFQENTTILREMVRYDELWDVEVLKAEANYSQNYDELNKILLKIEQLRKQLLQQQLLDTDAGLSEVEPLIARYLDLLAKKALSIETFKSQHSIKKNSKRYLPIAIEETFRQSASVPLLADLPLEDFKEHVYDFIMFSRPEDKAQLQEQLTQLSDHVQQIEDTDLKNRFETLISHTNIVMVYGPKINTLLDQIVLSGSIEAGNGVIDAYAKHHGELIETAHYYQLSLVGYASLLLTIIAIIGNKLRKSYRSLNNSNLELNRVNEELKNFNDTLESKVKRRTRVLNDTLAKLKNSQAQLVQSAKMASMGQMVAGIAHEINTPLGYVTSNVDIVESALWSMNELIDSFETIIEQLQVIEIDDQALKEQIKDINGRLTAMATYNYKEELSQLIDDMKYGLDSISEMVVNLKDFSRMDRAAYATCDIHQSIESSLKVANNNIKNTCTVVKEFGELPPIQCKPSQINQVLLNLINNACDAIKDKTGGKPGIIKIHTYCDVRNVFIECQDNGMGIDDSVRKRIFDPFFTTKDVGKGTGLGLSISHKIITDHKGTMKLASKKGVGTKFVIKLPIEQSDVQQEVMLKAV